VTGVRDSESEWLSERAWPGVVLATWEMLATRAAEIAEWQATGRTVLLRGQPQQWRLRPRLIRAAPEGAGADTLAAAERNAMSHFQSQAHLFHAESDLPENAHVDGSPELAWWSLMQHYGAPTRLLDWSSSPYVAAYFASEQFPREDGVVLVIDADRLNAHFEESKRKLGRGLYRTLDEPVAVWAFTPPRKTHRLVAQQGAFTVASHPDADHDDILEASGSIIRRWVVPSALKPMVLRHLRTMNVSAQTLFPGLDGLGRSTGELIKTILPRQ